LWVDGQGEEKHAANSDNLYQWFTQMREHMSELHGKEIDFTPHSMRHSALTNYNNGCHYVCRELGKAGFQIEQLRLIAHHDSIDTTQGYLPDTSLDELEGMFGIKIAD
jgi:integrase/recombinase XerD